ncbi:MAG: hypothetical protein M9890_10770, partial [Thermomicrobiales bacterium]|nr:hypothetical protein [Thermomicrobiales bacterium]
IIPEQDRGLWTRQQLTDRLAALLGGYAAEQAIFGDVTTGSSNDLEQVSGITISMVSRYGMGQAFGLLSAGEDASRGAGFSQRTAFAAESEARQIVDEAHALAQTVLTTRRDELEMLAATLLRDETVEGDELIAMLGPAATASDDDLDIPTLLRQPTGIAGPSSRSARKASRRERIAALPAAIVASAVNRRRRTVPGS